MIDLLLKLSDNAFVVGLAVPAVLAAVAFAYRSIVEYRDRKRIFLFLKSTAATGRYSFRTANAIAAELQLAPERVRDLCNKDQRVRRNAGGAESWTLRENSKGGTIDQGLLRIVAVSCCALVIAIAALMIDRSRRAGLVSITVNGSDESVVLVKGEGYIYEWKSTGQKSCDLESPFPSSVSLTGRSSVTPGQTLFYPTPNRPVTIRMACLDLGGRVTRKEVTIQMAAE